MNHTFLRAQLSGKKVMSSIATVVNNSDSRGGLTVVTSASRGRRTFLSGVESIQTILRENNSLNASEKPFQSQRTANIFLV